MKKLLLGLVLLLFVGVPVALFAAVLLCFQDEPAVRRTAAFTPEDVARAVRLFERNDPRKMKSGALRTVSIRGEDLDLAVNYLAHRYGRGSSRVVVQPGLLAVAASVEIPSSPFGRYLNVNALLRETSGLPQFEELRLGRLTVPKALADWGLERAMRALDGNDQYQVAADAIRSVSIADGSVRIVYEWRDDLPARVGKAMMTSGDSDRFRMYQERLATLTRDPALPSPVSLAQILGPLMAIATERGVAGDPQAESRAVIAVVAFYVNGKGLPAIVPSAKDWPRPVAKTVTLNGRTDLPQHFTVSAALAAHAGGPLSDAIGLYREVDDSRRGSGFSFNDIAADRAGTRFGEVATQSAASARSLQRRMTTGVRESDLMPEVADLPEFMSEAEFKRRFGGVGAPAYERMMQNIERRVAACPLYR